MFSAEYCGLNHSGMGGWVYVMEQRDFDNWLGGNVSGQTPTNRARTFLRINSAPHHAMQEALSSVGRNSRTYTVTT